MEKKCTVNFIFAVMLTVLSFVLLWFSFGYHDDMRRELYGGISKSESSGGADNESSAETGSDGAETAESVTVNEIPPVMMNYLITYGVSFISAAFSMLYSYRVFKNSKRRALVTASYCIFALDLISIAIGLLVRLGII